MLQLNKLTAWKRKKLEVEERIQKLEAIRRRATKWLRTVNKNRKELFGNSRDHRKFHQQTLKRIDTIIRETVTKLDTAKQELQAINRKVRETKQKRRKIISLVIASIVLLIFFGGFIAMGGYESITGFAVQDPEEESKGVLETASSIAKSISFPEPVIYREEPYDIVTIPKLYHYGEPGEPMLPFKTIKILLPAGEELESIQIDTHDKILLGEYYLKPAQQFYPISYNGTIEITSPDADIYDSDELYPGKFYSVVSTQKLKGYDLLIINLYPLQYQPKSRQVYYYEKIDLSIATTPLLPTQGLSVQESSIQKRNYRALDEDKAYVEKLIENPETLSTYGSTLDSSTLDGPASEGSPLDGSNGSVLDSSILGTTSLVDASDTYNYVIITNFTFNASFWPLIEWKEEKGLNATIIFVENITKDPDYWCDGALGDPCFNGTLFNDTPAMVRNFIRDAYNNWSTTYVLLGGDDEVIPVRGVYIKYGGYNRTPMPSDLYYGVLDGSWNNNNNTFWAEATDGDDGGDVDLAMEVHIGRATVDTTTEVDNFVNKTLEYEKNTSLSYLSQTLMVGENLDAVTWGAEHKEETEDYFPSHFNATTLYEKNSTFSDTNVKVKMNSNNTHIVNHGGHASQTAVMDLSRSEIDALMNDRFFLVYSWGCDTAGFDQRWSGANEAVSEHFVKEPNGAFAYIGNTRYGWYSSGSTSSPSHQYDKQFFEALFKENITHLGAAFDDAKEDLVGSIGTSVYRWIYMGLILFGDPELKITVNDTTAPTITFDYPVDETHYTGYSGEINVSIDEDGGNCSLNDTRWSYTTGNKTFFSFINSSAFSDENYSVEASCSDDEATPNNGSELLTFTIDTVIPNINFTVPMLNNGTYAQAYIPINVTAADAHLDTINISLFNSDKDFINSTNNATSPFFFNISLADGTYYINATASDEAGNTNSTETRNITLNASAPTITFTYPIDGTNYSDYTGEINISIDEEGGNCSLNDTRWSYTSGNKTFFSFINSSVFSDNNETINASCWDFSMHNGSKKLSFTIDTTAPNINFTLRTIVNGTYSQNWIAVNVTASDSNLKMIEIHFYNSNGTLIKTESNSSSPFFYNYTSLADDTYYVNATANDTANNINSTGIRTITLDTVAPIISFVYPVDGTNYSDYTGEINISISELGGNCSLNDTRWNYTLGNKTFFSFINGSAFSNGDYDINASCWDTVNNNGSSSLSFTVEVSTPADTTAPTITSVTSSSVTSSSAVITWTTNENANSTVHYGTTTATTSASSSTSLATSHSITLSSLSASTLYYYNVSSYDAAGNGATSSQSSFTTTAAAAAAATTTTGGGGGGGGGGGTTAAAVTFDIDFSRVASKTVSISTGGSQSLTFDGKTEHTFKVSKVKGNSAEITISSELVTFTLNVGETKEVDVNDDGLNDLSVTLNSIKGISAYLEIKKLAGAELVDKEVEEEIEGEVAEEAAAEEAEVEEAEVVKEIKEKMFVLEEVEEEKEPLAGRAFGFLKGIKQWEIGGKVLLVVGLLIVVLLIVLAIYWISRLK